jgi:hypothetical protein
MAGAAYLAMGWCHGSGDIELSPIDWILRMLPVFTEWVNLKQGDPIRNVVYGSSAHQTLFVRSRWKHVRLVCGEDR